MSWNYRVLDRDGELAVYEVYYREDGSVKGHSLAPSFPRGEDLNDLKEELSLYSEALNKPILKYDE